MNTKIVHATGDEALGLLSAAQSAGSSLVRSFPGKEDSEHPNWLDMWFLTKIEQHYNGAITDEDKTFFLRRSHKAIRYRTARSPRQT